ncbi:MAG: hypothetical protein ABS87_00920 [Sphingomonas sp. SCN 67-18]|nr:MAG: hypothetical protein ABS87_00920 [Sphingomonas sp. SCN 67-18]
MVERDLFRFITSSRTLEIAELRDEIADRIRSETDAREQLRALKASAVMRDPKTGRLLPKVVG